MHHRILPLLHDAPIESEAMRFRLISAAAVVLSLASASLGAAPSLNSLQFLIGDWQAIDATGGATGGFSFAFGVQNHVITRTNYSNSAATDDYANFHPQPQRSRQSDFRFAQTRCCLTKV